MHADFWLERWRDGRTHFHQTRVMPLLQKYWATLNLPAGSRVLVPLCGKSLDMLWLAQQGMHVLGVELSQVGVELFFAENGLQPEIRHSSAGIHYSTANIEIICGDIFKLDDATLANCAGVYDRAALVALPPEMRAPYVQHVYAKLPPSYKGLLITLDYAQALMGGPPFAVPDAEVQGLYAAHSHATVIDRSDILQEEPKFIARGLSKLDELVFRLEGKA